VHNTYEPKLCQQAKLDKNVFFFVFLAFLTGSSKPNENYRFKKSLKEISCHLGFEKRFCLNTYRESTAGDESTSRSRINFS